MTRHYYINECPGGRGRGVFANRAFVPGEYILSFSGKHTPIHEIIDFTHYLQVAPGMFLSPTGKEDDFVNHSCDPNCAVYFENGGAVLRAVAHIARNDELSFDYGTVMFSEPTTFHCECGSPKCRGLIGSFYTLPETLRHYYLTKNMVPLLNHYTLEELRLAENTQAI